MHKRREIHGDRRGAYISFEDKLVKVLYDYLRSFMSVGHTSILVDGLLKMIGISHRYGNWNQKHLLKAVKEINEKQILLLWDIMLSIRNYL